MLVSVIVYIVMQIESVGGVHERTAEVGDFGENEGCKGVDKSKR